MKIHFIQPENEWPEGISDGLILPCSVCGETTNIDYHIAEEVWRRDILPELQLGVICLGCLTAAIGRGPVAHALKRIQITLPGMTIVCNDFEIFNYEARKR